MKRALIQGFVLLLGSATLGAIVFREPVAWAAKSVDVKVIEPLDGAGNVKVHEQGTVNVDVTNKSLSVTTTPITGGGDRVLLGAGVPLSASFDPPMIATALSIGFVSKAMSITFSYEGSTVATFWGPFFFGNNVALALTRPIIFDAIECQVPEGDAAAACTASWIGAEP